MFTLVVHDLAWSWIGLRSVPRQFLQKCVIVLGELFGISQVHGNALRYTNVILFRILIISDEGTSGKINTFTHQVTIQTSPLKQARMAFTVRPDFCSA